MGLADALIPGVASNVSNLVARKQLKFKEFTASGTFVVGTGGDATTTNTIFNVFVVGGGGGGGLGSVTLQTAGTISAVIGGAGGGGECVERTVVGSLLFGGASTGTVSVTIGAGGVGGAASNGGTAAVGGDSSFGAIVAQGGGRGASMSASNATDTIVAALNRATNGGVSVHEDRAGTSAAYAIGGGGGGGAPWPIYATSSWTAGHDLIGPQNGRGAVNSASTTFYNPDFGFAGKDFDNPNETGNVRCGAAGPARNGVATGAAGLFGRGGNGINGFGGGASGAQVSAIGTTVATVLVAPSGWSIATGTAYNDPYYTNVDGGGRGALVTASATANYIAATSGSANTGGGGGGGAAFGTGTTYYNSVSAGGSGAAGYCLVYWWE